MTVKSFQMRSKLATTHWSDELARVLLASLPDGSLDASGDLAADRMMNQARNDAEARWAIMAAWRSAHPEVVHAARFISIAGPSEQCSALLRQFSAEDVLLELITDPLDDGWELAQWCVENVQSSSARQELAAILQHWSGQRSGQQELEATAEKDVDSNTGESSSPLRIVIFGGHIRDEQKMTRRLFEKSSFEVRWNPCEKSQKNPDTKILHQAMLHADAVLLVTTMVSHNIMRIVKRFTQERQIPFRTIPKATDLHLKAALAELFPDRMRLEE